jgi:hypothetical protein
MFRSYRRAFAATSLTIALLASMNSVAIATVRIEGQVQAGGGALASSTVTLWAASAGEPKQLAQAKTDSGGKFQLSTEETVGADAVLYMVANGGEAQVNKGSGNNPVHRSIGSSGPDAPSKGCRQ